ncbi:MAG: hypothetical protein R3A13_09180 [Bdellovibrionota bacterium]
MAVCLDYQLVAKSRPRIVISVRMQILVIAVLLFMLGFKVWTQICCTNLGYKLAKAREQAVVLDMERRELELQLSVLLRPNNLTSEATKRLGLQTLNPERARRLKY